MKTSLTVTEFGGGAGIALALRKHQASHDQKSKSKNAK
jgi:hypothetical protein